MTSTRTSSSIERLSKDIERMQQEITALQGYFDAWLLLAGEPTRSYYLSALRQYNTFFLFVQNAFFAAFVVAAYKIWDKRGCGDVLTILQLAAEAEKAPGFWNGAEAQMDKLEKDRSQGEKIWRKVGILRNEYFAHLNIDRFATQRVQESRSYSE